MNALVSTRAATIAAGLLASWLALAPLVAGSANAPNSGARWEAIGPSPPAVDATVLADPASRTVYVGSLGGGVLKSTDGGYSFAAVNNGLGALTVSAMVMAPNSPNVVYASTPFNGIFKTIDGGAHWTDINGGGVSLAVDPNNPNTIYAGQAPRGGVLKTTDGGATWVPASTGLLGNPAVFALAIDPNNTNVVYAGTQGQGAYKSTDGAASWTPINVDSTVWSLLIDPADSDIVYAGTFGNGVYKSTDAGASFARIGSPDVGVVLALAKSGQSLYAGTATQGVSVSRDGGATWKNTGVSHSSALTLNVDTAGSVYLGTSFDGSFVLQPGHTHWRRLAGKPLQECACQNGHAIAVDPGNARHLFLTTNSGGLLVTEDGGRSWRDGGVDGFVSISPRGVGFDPQEPRRVYAGSFTGGGLFKSEDHGQHWQRRLFGSSAIYVTGIAVDPVDHSVYAATFSGKAEGIWKSTDFGDTFTRIDRAPSAAPGVYLGLKGRTVTIDPRHHSTLYFADNGPVMGIWRSQDAGQSWIQVDATDRILAVTVDPSDSTVVYGTAGAVGVLKSVDGGNTFTNMSVGLPPGVQTARTGFLQVNPRRPNIVYVGTEGGGVYKSSDGAATWIPLNRGLADLDVTGLAMDPRSPNTVYAATASLSVFRLEEDDD